MRSFLRLAWMTLVLLIVALSSALVAMHFAVHGREVKVPDFQGKTPGDARRIADGDGLIAQVEREYYSAKVPQGRVLSQVPAAGSVVRRGWTVRLALSLGPQRVAIPQVVGQTERVADISIRQRGLDVASSAAIEFPGAIAGQVIGQDPPANANDVSAPKISLLVAQEPPPQAYVMPSFIGQPLGTVTNKLRDAGLRIGQVTVTQPPEVQPQNMASQPVAPASGAGAAPSDVPPLQPSPVSPPLIAAPTAASTVVSQEPAPGQKVLSGSSINLVVR
jgi:beta-lactam-binding protein with PASTA domain